MLPGCTYPGGSWHDAPRLEDVTRCREPTVARGNVLKAVPPSSGSAAQGEAAGHRVTPHGRIAPGRRDGILSSRQLVGYYAPREPDARRRYLLRVKNPDRPTDATHDEYRLAARLSTSHARGARAYRQEWTTDDQSLADRVAARRKS